VKVQLGQIWLARLDPTQGSVQAGTRPVVVMSGNLMNQYMSVILACPLTTKVKGYRTNVVLEPSPGNGLKDESEVLTVHIRSISKERLIKYKGQIEEHQIMMIHERLHDIITL